MFYKKMWTKLKLNRIASAFIAVALFMPLQTTFDAFAVGEPPEQVYAGFANSSAVLNNIDYNDVRNSDTWAKEAIYSSGALGIMKGYGDRQFGRTNTVSKEQAIAIAYRVAGREADAQKAAENLDNARAQEDKKRDALSMWSDGYLQLAANEGLITQQDLNDALNGDPLDTGGASFNRNAPAQRQEMAFWLAKTLKLQPVYGQQKIFNSFNDWKEADPIKIPYIEAILQNNIMNGSGNGYFNPTQPLTREQTAQIIRNAENIILPVLSMEKRTGVVEGIEDVKDVSNGAGITKRIINVRSSNGKLHQIVCEIPEGQDWAHKNEQNGALINAGEKEVVVYKNGRVGKSGLLGVGDSIEYIAAADTGTAAGETVVSAGKVIRYIRVLAANNRIEYIGARINGIDAANLSINVTERFRLRDIENGLKRENVSFDVNGSGEVNKLYRYSDNVLISVNGKAGSINDIKTDMEVLLTVRGGIVTGIKAIDTVSFNEESGIVKGIVEDNNPGLGYITLYNEDGTGTSPGMSGALALFRTYYFADKNEVEVFKNHQTASLEDVEVGDSVFIKLDEQGRVVSISAVDNYVVKFGKVITKRDSILTVEYDDGTGQVLEIGEDTLVISDRKLSRYESLKDGDRVKLMLHITNKFTKVKEITIEGDEHFVANIYKGIVSYIDDASRKLVVQNLQVLDRGSWVLADVRGVSAIRLSDGYKIYANDRSMSISSVNKYLRNSEAYIAVEKDYGGEERAVFVSYRNGDDTEVLYDDTVSSSVTGANEFGLSKNYGMIKLGKGAIIVKDGRLVSGSSIMQDDKAYVVANRSFDDGEFYAGVVQIGKRFDALFARIYRGRIKQINENKDFTVESFSRLDGQTWSFANTPKTFNITFATRILDESGVVDAREFLDYGDSSFKGKTVYIVEKDSNALLVSTAPYGPKAFKGEILEVTGGAIGDEGSITKEPTGLTVRKAKVYDQDNFVWKDCADLTLNILNNSIIIKNGKIARPSELKKGDSVMVMKKDAAETGDAYIIIVEK